MTVDELLAAMKSKAPPAPAKQLAAFEKLIGQTLPDDYRAFLIACNGGHLGGRLWFKGPTPEGKKADAGVAHIGGFRDENYFSLMENYETYQSSDPPRIPKSLVWIMDDPFGNAICLGVAGKHRGRVYFWDHENEPDTDDWDGKVETAGNITLLAITFTGFVEGLQALKAK